MADNLFVSYLFMCPSILVSPLLIMRLCHTVKIANAIKTPIIIRCIKYLYNIEQ